MFSYVKLEPRFIWFIFYLETSLSKSALLFSHILIKLCNLLSWLFFARFN